ncbi:hypothetical protein PF003_g24402 [Phytophthora fragariae]|nr:hypothetical protein PF003_g24402 [Phytophthora fragariae]
MILVAVSGSVAEAGDGVRARGWQAAAAHQQGARLLVTCIAAIEVLTIAMCFAPMTFVGVSGSVAEAGGGVRAADGNLPLPSRRFMTPEVGRSWRY